METNQFISDKLDEIRDKSENRLLDKVSDDFIFAYGPYMCMAPGYFESEADEIAKHSKIMQIMVYTAYLIRNITFGMSYNNAKKMIKEFIISIDDIFPESDSGYEKERETLINFGKDYLSKIREEQKLKGDLESFMTNASPVVPYSQNLKRTDLMDATEENTRVDLSEKIQEALDESSEKDPMVRRKYLLNLLLNNLGGIMMNYKLCSVLTDDKTGQPNLLVPDKLVLKDDEVYDAVKIYYFLATINYYRLPDKIFEKYLNFFKEMGNFNKYKSYAAFESLVEEMASNTNVDIATEAWEDPTLMEKADNAILEIISDAPGYKGDNVDDRQDAKFDLNQLENFISNNRFMKFEEYPNRLFVSSLEKSRIVQFNKMADNRIYYELDSGIIACPFLDLRDYQAKVVVLYADTDRVEINDDMRSL